MRKGHNAGYSHFLLFPQHFEKEFADKKITVTQEDKKTLWKKEKMLVTIVW